MQVAALQLDIVWEDKPANHANVRALLRDMGLEPGAMVVLPEMFDTGFSMNVATVADTPDAPASLTFLQEVAREHNVTVVAGIVNAASDGRGLNLSVTIDPQGRQIARYQKMQPFSMGGETEHYIAGDTPVVFDWRGCAVSPFVCYDLRFPEVFRPAVRMGAELFTVIANWPKARAEHWVTLLRARAIENQCVVVGVNRCGVDPTLEYPGRTMIVDPHGNVVADAGDAEGVITADVDLEALREYRGWFKVLDDMRDELVARDGLSAHATLTSRH